MTVTLICTVLLISQQCFLHAITDSTINDNVRQLIRVHAPVPTDQLGIKQARQNAPCVCRNIRGRDFITTITGKMRGGGHRATSTWLVVMAYLSKVTLERLPGL